MTRGVVTGCNLKFAAGAAGLLRSIRRFHPEAVRYCLTPAAEVAEVQAHLGDLATVLAPPRPIRGVPDQWLLQLLAARTLLPAFAEGVIAWVDCDVVFCGPADALFEVPEGSVNVVQDAVYNLGNMVPADVWEQYARQFHCQKTDRGFNAGIYALRRSDWLDLPERYEKAVEDGHYSYYPPGFDQALLNGLFRGRTNWLPATYNWHAVFERGVPRGTRIVHYTDNPKPWQPGYGAHRPGYCEWMRYGEEASALQSFMYKAYNHLSAPRRFGYKAIRKVLTKVGFWRHEVGVSTPAKANP